MHQCLQILEIVQEIVDNVLPKSSRQYGNDHLSLTSVWDSLQQPRRDLFALTITSKNFFDAGLNVLWRDVDSLIPILVLLGVPYDPLKNLNQRRLTPGFSNRVVANIFKHATFDRVHF